VENGNGGKIVSRAGYMAEFRDFIPGRPERLVGHLPTCNISYKRSVFEKYGFFKGEYYPQEDLVFHHHIGKKGVKIYSDPSIRVFHFHRRRMRDFLVHQKRVGQVTAAVLRTISLQGAQIARRRLLGGLALPVLPLVKFMRTVIVFLRYQPRCITERPAVLAVLAAGMLWWVVGFARGMHSNR
jgi:hypothetical protein